MASLGLSFGEYSVTTLLAVGALACIGIVKLRNCCKAVKKVPQEPIRKAFSKIPAPTEAQNKVLSNLKATNKPKNLCLKLVPDAVALQILGLLTPEQLALLSRTNKKWYSLADKPYLWKNFNLCKIYPYLKILNESTWKAHVDCAKLKIDVSDVQFRGTLTEMADSIPKIKRVATFEIEGDAGVTLLTMPKGNSWNKLKTFADDEYRANTLSRETPIKVASAADLPNNTLPPNKILIEPLSKSTSVNQKDSKAEVDVKSTKAETSKESAENPTIFRFFMNDDKDFLENDLNAEVERTYTVAISNSVLEKTRNHFPDEQEDFLHLYGCQPPDPLELGTLLILTYAVSPKENPTILFNFTNKGAYTYGRCKKGNAWIEVGGFNQSGGMSVRRSNGRLHESNGAVASSK